VSNVLDPFDRLKDRLNNPPKFWDPEAKAKDPEKAYQETTVMGQVEEIDLRENEWGTFHNTIIRVPDGTRVSVGWYGTVLSKRFVKLDLQLGDYVGIRFLGRQPSSTPGMADYANFDAFKVTGDAELAPEPEPEPDVDPVLARAEAELGAGEPEEPEEAS
jgi:hypothetical protein